MDSTKRDNKEVQEKLMALQKEKDQVKQLIATRRNGEVSPYSLARLFVDLLVVLLHKRPSSFPAHSCKLLVLLKLVIVEQ